MLTLRPYQHAAVDAVIELGRLGRRKVCLVAPTGAGKTVLGTAIAARSVARGRKVLWLVHRKELVWQSVKACERADIADAVTVATVQGMREQIPGIGLVVVDECHHYVADVWHEVVKQYEHAPVLGLTATPERADGTPLSGMFDALTVAAHYSFLVREGYLVKCRVKGPKQEDNARLAEDAASAYMTHGENRKGFIYAGTVDHAEEITRRLIDYSVPAATISERTPAKQRELALAEFRAGNIRVLTNVNVLTEGVDVPDASVAILARSVHHAGQYLQIAGRILRTAPGKADALLVDLTESWAKHGSPTMDRAYTLDGTIRRSEQLNGKRCPRCSYIADRGVSVCPDCGHVFERTAREKANDIIDRRDIADVTQWLHDQEVQAEIYRTLREKHGSQLWKIKRDYEAITGRSCVIHDATMEEKSTEADRLRDIAAKHGYKDGWVSHRYRAMFGVWPKGV